MARYIAGSALVMASFFQETFFGASKGISAWVEVHMCNVGFDRVNQNCVLVTAVAESIVLAAGQDEPKVQDKIVPACSEVWSHQI